MKKIVIIGDSGHAKVVADVVNSHKNMMVYAKLDDKYSGTFVEDGVLKGPIRHLDRLIGMDFDIQVVLAIGSNAIRQQVVSRLGLPDDMYARPIHSTAIISPSAKIGMGTVVMPGAIVNAEATIGDHVIVNSGSVVEHDCVIEDYVHVSPLAVLTGGVYIGEGTHIGAGASVIPLMNIGSWSTVGARAVVVSDIQDNVTVVGAPARVVKRDGVSK